MIYGYARVSTRGQDKYGNGLEVQEKQLRENGAEVVYYESYTGTKKTRPELDKLMAVLKDGDTIVVTKLDRIARSTRDGLDIIDKLLSKGVYINILNMGKFDHSPTGKLMRTVFFAFAEFERDMIIMRTAEGKAVCRENDPDWREGRRSIEVPDFNSYYEKVQKAETTVVEACKLLGISRSKWYNLVREVS
jgi:DNA invertase Pin-like site-specific DNA recombinase